MVGHYLLSLFIANVRVGVRVKPILTTDKGGHCTAYYASVKTDKIEKQ
jgi:hypothetical protein